jgi:hypothetical protein
MAYEAFFKVATSKLAPKSPQVVDILLQGWRTGQTSTAVEKLLKSQGLSYRRINFLEDWRRAGHIANINQANTEKVERALNYFDNVIEPYRKQEGLTYDKALKNLHKWEKNREKLIEAADDLANQAINYGFDTSP